MNDTKVRGLLRRSWHAGLALAGARPPAKAQATSAEAMLLSSALQALRSDDLPTLMQSACNQLRVFSGADCTSVVLIDSRRGQGACRIAAGDGWSDAVVGERIELTLCSDGSLPLPRSGAARACADWVEPAMFARHGLSAGVWVPIEHDDRTIGWITAHAHGSYALNKASRSVATALAGIVGAALRRDHNLRDLRQQAVQARALCQQLPVLWMSIDGHSATVLDCSAAIGNWLGYPTVDCIGKPASDFLETTDAVVVGETLCRPIATGAEVGVPLRLRHRNGSVSDCVADGALVGDSSAGPSGTLRVQWVFHERKALQWGTQRTSDSDNSTAPSDFDWTLESDRERRQQSLRLLTSLRHGLHGLQNLFNESATDVPQLVLRSSELSARVRSLLDEAWQASEKAAIALASPNERVTDLLAALQRLASDISDSTPVDCVLECPGPEVRLGTKGKLAVFRATRELLLQMVNEWNQGKITVQLETKTPGFIRVRLIRQPQEDGKRGKPQTQTNPALGGGLGLFGTKTMLAGVGGALTIAPGQHGTTFAEFQIPVAATAATGRIVRGTGGT